MKLAWGRLAGGIGAVLYWVTNPLWVGGSLAFISTDAWRSNVFAIGHGSFGDYVFKIVFIWISIGVAIASLRYGKWIPNLGAFLRFGTLGLFSITVVVYGAKHGFHGFSGHDASPTKAVFIGLVPVLLFNYVGFELQNGAAEEMENPQRDVPVSVFQSAVLGVFSYVIPILGILLVLPLAKVTGIGGFIDAVSEVFTVYGSAAHTLLVFDDARLRRRPRHLGRGLDDRLGPRSGCRLVRRRVLSVLRHLQPKARDARARQRAVGHRLDGVLCAAVAFFNSGADSTFQVVLDIAISTTLLSYVMIFPAILKLRYSHGDVPRPYTFRSGSSVSGWERWS